VTELSILWARLQPLPTELVPAYRAFEEIRDQCLRTGSVAGGGREGEGRGRESLCRCGKAQGRRPSAEGRAQRADPRELKLPSSCS